MPKKKLPTVNRNDIFEIKIKNLIPRANNANSMTLNQMSQLKRNLREQQGLTEAIIVCPHPTKKDRYEILDGHQRVKAYKSLGFDEILCDVWDVGTEEDKIVLELTLNDLHGTTDAVKRSKILADAAAKLSEDHFLGRIPGAMEKKEKAEDTTPTAAPPTKSTAVQSAAPAKAPSNVVTQFKYPVKWGSRVDAMLGKAEYLLEEDDYDSVPQNLNGKALGEKSRRFLAIVLFTELHLNLDKPTVSEAKKPKNKSNGKNGKAKKPPKKKSGKREK